MKKEGEAVEGKRRRECEASEAQGLWQGQARNAPIQDPQDLR